MKNFLFIIPLFSLILIGAGCNNQAETLNRIKNLENELSKTKQELQEAQNKEPKVIEKPIYIQPKQNDELILINYKLDAQNGENIRNNLLEGAYNSPSQMCPSIIAERTTRQNIYYMVLDDIAELKSKYGRYRNSIIYIDNNLNGLDGTIEIVKDKCASLGYYF